MKKNYATVNIDKRQLRKAIEAHGLTLAQAAALVGKAPSYFALRKKGAPETISLTTAKAIEGALGIKLEAYEIKEPVRVPAPVYETPEQMTMDAYAQHEIIALLKEIAEGVSVLAEHSGKPVPDDDPDW